MVARLVRALAPLIRQRNEGCVPLQLALYRAQPDDAPASRLPPLEVAQQSGVFRIRRLLSQREIDEVHRLGERLPWYRPNPQGSRQTCYLNGNRRFMLELPRLRSKLLEAVRRVDGRSWKLLHGRAVSPRCVEYHKLTRGKDVSVGVA